MSNFSKITIVDIDDITHTTTRPVGFGVNENNFFCIESTAQLFMIPVDRIKTVEVEKSTVLTVS